MQRARHGSRVHGEPDDLPEPKAFAESITADHKILNEHHQSRHYDQVCLVILDRFTQWLQSYACKSKNAHDTLQAFQRFLGPNVKAKHTYTDGSKEFEKAMDLMEACHDTSTPYASQTNGVAERAVRKVKEGTACLLDQSGLSEEWWAEAMDCFCSVSKMHKRCPCP